MQFITVATILAAAVSVSAVAIPEKKADAAVIPPPWDPILLDCADLRCDRYCSCGTRVGRATCNTLYPPSLNCAKYCWCEPSSVSK